MLGRGTIGYSSYGSLKELWFSQGAFCNHTKGRPIVLGAPLERNVTREAFECAVVQGDDEVTHPREAELRETDAILPLDLC